jgi:hypothetical protein
VMSTRSPALTLASAPLSETRDEYGRFTFSPLERDGQHRVVDGDNARANVMAIYAANRNRWLPPT